MKQYLRYQFTEEECISAKTHAELVVPGVCYSWRDNQKNQKKIERDILIGKLGEFGVWNLLKERFPAITEPDLKIYPARKKTWSPDLDTPDFSIAVKSQDIMQSKRYGPSWVFEKTGKDFKNMTKPAYIALVLVDVEARTCEVRAIIKAESAIYDEPKVEFLKATKKVIYDESVIDRWEL